MTVTGTTAQSVHDFMNDPIGFFGQSYTRMHSIGRHELEDLQRQAMRIRFQEHYRSIEMLRKLADRLGITALNEFNDVAPLMFSHTAFKSYPPALSALWRRMWPTRKGAPTPESSTCSAARTPRAWPTPTGSAN